jgi:hypothetical protein
MSQIQLPNIKSKAMARKNDIRTLEAQGLLKALLDVKKNDTEIAHPPTRRKVSAMASVISLPKPNSMELDREARKLVEKTQMVTLPPVRRNYTDDERRLAILPVCTACMTYRQATSVYGIPDRTLFRDINDGLKTVLGLSECTKQELVAFCSDVTNIKFLKKLFSNIALYMLYTYL